MTSETSASSPKPVPVGEPSRQNLKPVRSGRGALSRIVHNLRDTPRAFRDSVVRHGRPSSDRAASQAVFGNVFLHILPTRIHRDVLRARTTWGLGVITFVLFLLLIVTGVAVMTYYKPSIAQAYDSMKELQYIVPTGRFMRNIHRWAAHAMVVCVLLHMARAFYTAAYTAPRQFNWVVGMILFVLTLGLSFTGYLLPWDQLAFWAVTIGSEIAQSPREVTDALGITAWFDPGGMVKHLLLGADHVGQEALTRFYLLHVMVLPVLMAVFIVVHFWRIRKDGGLARPPWTATSAGETSVASAAQMSSLSVQIPENVQIPGSTPSKTYGLMAVVRGKTPAVDRNLAETVPTHPHGLYAVAALSMFTLAVMLVLGYFFDAPLTDRANPLVPENPAKAPWYFLGVQELVSYSAFAGGVAIPALVVLGLMLVPYLDRERDGIGTWFGGKGTRWVCLTSALFAAVVVVGMLTVTVNFGWLRDWFPRIPQLVITLVNPGTLFVALFAVWSLLITKVTNSTRKGALAVFTCFLISFVILTYFATVFRGPNWGFYWSRSDWPLH